MLLEMLIALFLVAMCALPLAELPSKAIQQELKSAYRMQMHRVADLAFAEVKAKLYRREIPWETIAQPHQTPALITDNEVEIVLGTSGKRTFKQTGTLDSIGKRSKDGVEWRLATFRVTFEPAQKNFKLFFPKKKDKENTCSFTYQLLVSRSPPKN